MGEAVGAVDLPTFISKPESIGKRSKRLEEMEFLLLKGTMNEIKVGRVTRTITKGTRTGR
jgi:hypothetical protein